MDYGNISRKFLMELIEKTDKAIWDEYGTYEKVGYYIDKWHEDDGSFWENFRIEYKDEDRKQINLRATLHNMSPDMVVKVAIEFGVETPGFLPSIPTFINVLKDENESAFQNFDRAAKNVNEHPDNAVALAASTLEGVIKTILSHEKFPVDVSKVKNSSLTKLVQEIVKQLGFDDPNKCPPEIIRMAGQLRSLGATIDDLRSDKSTAHGKSASDYVVDDPLWAMLTINACSTLGLFLWEYFAKKYLPAKEKEAAVIDLDRIPF